MIVVNNTCTDYNEGTFRFWDFEKYADQAKDCILFFGCEPHASIQNPSTKQKFFFSTEEQPNSKDTTYKYEPFVDKIFTICPKTQGRPKREYVYYPLPASEHIPTINDKKYDVIYVGYSVNALFIQNILNSICKYNHRFVSFNHHLATDKNVTFHRKMQLIGESRIAIVHNLLTPDEPQLKTRPFEAAIMKSLILCKRDQFGTIEKWFEPNKEFVYYDKDEDLQDKISNILNNYSSYQATIDAAYIKVQNYTVEKFIGTYIGWINK